MNNKIPVPAALLAIDGAAPAQGDEVEMTVTGIVEAVQGPMLLIRPTKLNGQPLPEMPAEPARPTSEDDIRAAALAADREV